MENKLLPHGEAFLFLDEIISADSDQVVGLFTFKRSHKAFQGQTGSSVPQMLLIESIIQCGGAGVRKAGFTNGLFALVKIEVVKFLLPIAYDQMVTYKINNLDLKEGRIYQKGEGFVDDKLAIVASWSTVRIKK